MLQDSGRAPVSLLYDNARLLMLVIVLQESGRVPDSALYDRVRLVILVKFNQEEGKVPFRDPYGATVRPLK